MGNSVDKSSHREKPAIGICSCNLGRLLMSSQTFDEVLI